MLAELSRGNPRLAGQERGVLPETGLGSLGLGEQGWAGGTGGIRLKDTQHLPPLVTLLFPSIHMPPAFFLYGNCNFCFVLPC